MTFVLMDRDGVINQNRDDYVRTVDDLVFLPGVFDGLAKLRNAGISTVIISNQAGIGRGLINSRDLKQIDNTLTKSIARNGGHIKAIYYCTHRKEDGCTCRKPEIGLLQKASDELGFDLADSYFIGDTGNDIEAGHRAGCRTVLVLSGLASVVDILSWQHKPDVIAAGLSDAVDWVLHSEREKGKQA